MPILSAMLWVIEPELTTPRNERAKSCDGIQMRSPASNLTSRHPSVVLGTVRLFTHASTLT